MNRRRDAIRTTVTNNTTDVFVATLLALIQENIQLSRKQCELIWNQTYARNDLIRMEKIRCNFVLLFTLRKLSSFPCPLSNQVRRNWQRAVCDFLQWNNLSLQRGYHRDEAVCGTCGYFYWCSRPTSIIRACATNVFTSKRNTKHVKASSDNVFKWHFLSKKYFIDNIYQLRRQQGPIDVRLLTKRNQALMVRLLHGSVSASGVPVLCISLAPSARARESWT